MWFDWQRERREEETMAFIPLSGITRKELPKPLRLERMEVVDIAVMLLEWCQHPEHRHLEGEIAQCAGIVYGSTTDARRLIMGRDYQMVRARVEWFAENWSREPESAEKLQRKARALLAKMAKIKGKGDKK
jgi:hypothetical protein